MMQLKDLQAFQTIAEMGNLHHAAHALGVTQPALTKTVQRLETALGVRLLERTARGVALTSIGRTLVARSRTLGQMVDDIQTEIHDLKIGQTGELRIGAVPALIDSVVSPALSHFLGREDVARFQVHIKLSGALLRDLGNGHLDLAVAAVQDRIAPELNYTVLGEQRSFIVARRDHPLLRQPFALADLARQRWLLPPADIALRSWIDSLFTEHLTAVPDVFVEADTSPVVFASIVARTDLLTVLTTDSLHSPLAEGLAVLPPPAHQWSIPIGLFWRRNAYFSSLMKHCRQQLAKAFAQRPHQEPSQATS
ncbi:MAG: LysR family transcriptional regulator [Burkholderiaceae bacterium]|nr:LysR family transcriptional regulator [Rhodoferax sp.]MCB2030584.1 LysR family transcriptional regulator [Rhodoferax sp.]MCB2043286.1 LysR family transcriptional regulator [Rhodoferax sp.]MCP5261514.1 LysR family transcriptional regulator [Rhodoferax sp.]